MCMLGLIFLLNTAPTCFLFRIEVVPVFELQKHLILLDRFSREKREVHLNFKV